MKKYFTLFLGLVFGVSSFAQSNLEKDKQAIKALAGFYEVTFNYAETFATENTYQYKPRYESHGSEWVVVIEETPTKISMQHILVLGKDMVMKHWREDWIYEDPTLLAYDKDNAWVAKTISKEQAKGSWVQKVYQVDDSPRYEGRGTWLHADGKSRWESETDSPLPRRENSKREDYNVLKRLNRVYSTPTGWMFEQDNQKIIREGGKDQLLVREKGLEEFVKIDEKIFDVAKTWWAGQAPFWKAVRGVWSDVYAKNPNLKLHVTVENKQLYDHLFPMADLATKEKWTEQKSASESSAVIQKYIVKNAAQSK